MLHFTACMLCTLSHCRPAYLSALYIFPSRGLLRIIYGVLIHPSYLSLSCNNHNNRKSKEMSNDLPMEGDPWTFFMSPEDRPTPLGEIEREHGQNPMTILPWWLMEQVGKVCQQVHQS